MPNHVRSRLRFAIVRSTVIALRGLRGRGKNRYYDTGLDQDEVPLELIPAI